MKVGVIGCGNIFDIYLQNSRRFLAFEIVCCADIDINVARRKAEAHGIRALSIEELLRSDVEIVLNLTIPSAHGDVSIAALDAGKHVYSEKPLAASVRQGREILEVAAQRGLRVAASPDTILGPAVQTAVRLVSEGVIGTPLFATSAVVSHGMEHRHSNPGFFYASDAGSVLDMGPYYLAAVVALFGPIHEVSAVGRIGNAERIVTTPTSPIRGRTIKIEALTTVQAILTCRSGVQVSFVASWDAWSNTLPFFETHGTEGSLSLPNLNWFGGELKIATADAPWKSLDTSIQPFGVPNYSTAAGAVANYRGIGIADLVHSIKEGRQPRLDGSFGLHILEAMDAIVASATNGGMIRMTTDCLAPAALQEADAATLAG